MLDLKKLIDIRHAVKIIDKPIAVRFTNLSRRSPQVVSFLIALPRCYVLNEGIYPVQSSKLVLAQSMINEFVFSASHSLV